MLSIKTHMDIALEQYKQKEIVGPQDNQDIVNYFAKVGHSWVKDDETAWCAAFVGYCLEVSGQKSTGELNARSYLDWGKPTTEPEVGDIVVFWRGKKSGWQGHVGFFVKETPTHIYVLGGNQSNEVNITPYSKEQFLGYRKVTDRKTSIITLLITHLLKNK